MSYGNGNGNGQARRCRPKAARPKRIIPDASLTPLPVDEEAERSVLGSCLLDSERIDEIAPILERAGGGAAFFGEVHRVLWGVIAELHAAGRLAGDDVALKDELVRRGLFEKIGGYETLMRLASAVPTSARAAHYASIVADRAIERQLVDVADAILREALDPPGPTVELLENAERALCAVTERRVHRDAAMMPVERVYAEIMERAEGSMPGKSTGYFALDQIIGGLRDGEFTVIAARPGMGKSALGLCIALNLVLSEQMPVLFCSLEMSSESLCERAVCGLARISAKAAREGRLGATEKSRLRDAAERLNGQPLYIDDSSMLTPSTLRAAARVAQRRHGIMALFVDYLQLMTDPVSAKHDGRVMEVTSISRGLRAIAKDLNIPVVAMCQLNRKAEERADKRPTLADLRESGAIEQDAHTVMLIYRDGYYREESPDGNAAEIIVAKQRNGPTGTAKLAWVKEYTRFENLSFASEPGAPAPDNWHP